MAIPKQKQIPSAKKEPKIAANPISYNTQNLSWQLHLIDLDTKWGLNYLKDQIEFKGLETVTNSFNDISNDLFDALVNLDGKNFDSTSSFLDRLHIESKENLTVKQYKEILNCIGQNIFWTHIYPKLRHFESTNWNDLIRETHDKFGKTKHHSVDVSSLIPAAKKRLRELNLDDIEELFSLRIDNLIRIWGIRKFSYLQILWFDLEHEICPSKK